MKIAFINRTDSGSSGTIAKNIFEYCLSKRNDCIFIASEQNLNSNGYSIDNSLMRKQINRCLVKFLGNDGFLNSHNTKKIISLLKKFQPDIVCLQTIVGYFLNLDMLMSYLNRNKIKVVITLHDCWYFTGKCTHFEFNKCYKWKTTCYRCPALHDYPQSIFFDTSKQLFNKKKKLLSNKKNVVIVTPSQWLMNYVKQSFLKNNELICINNGIDLNSFIPLQTLKDKNNNGKTNLLFVAYPWNEKKGISTIKYLLDNLDSNLYNFVIAGATKFENIDRYQNVTFLGRLLKEQLIKQYQSADILINPTLEDNFPTVDIEALACGLPIISYDTGGSNEIIGKCGVLVEKNNCKKMTESILNFKKEKFSSDICINQANKFSNKKMCETYYDLFMRLYKNGN